MLAIQKTQEMSIDVLPKSEPIEIWPVTCPKCKGDNLLLRQLQQTSTVYYVSGTSIIADAFKNLPSTPDRIRAVCQNKLCRYSWIMEKFSRISELLKIDVSKVKRG